VVRESDVVENARHALGAQLAEYRRAVGYNQAELGAMIGYSRSTVANVETGRQHVPPHFWKSADEAVHAEGVLIALSGETEAAAMREREEGAQARRLYFVGVVKDGMAVTGSQLVHMPGDAVDAPGHMAGWLDAIAMAAGQAREHAENAAVTDVGPGTVEQFRADVVRLGRAYVSAPPLPLFAAMHQALASADAWFPPAPTFTGACAGGIEKNHVARMPAPEITAVDFQSIGKTTAILTFRSDLLGGLRLAHESAVL